MKQKAFSLDAISQDKTIKGFLISLGGALLAGFVLLIPEVNDLIVSNDPIEWRHIILAVWGAVSTGLVNMVREYIKGE